MFQVCRGQHLAKVQGRNGGEPAAGCWAEEAKAGPWGLILLLLMESCKRHRASQLFASSGAKGGWTQSLRPDWSKWSIQDFKVVSIQFPKLVLQNSSVNEPPQQSGLQAVGQPWFSNNSTFPLGFSHLSRFILFPLSFLTGVSVGQIHSHSPSMHSLMCDVMEATSTSETVTGVCSCILMSCFHWTSAHTASVCL